MTEGYCEYLNTEDTSKRSTDEYHSCENNDDSELDLRERISPKELAATTQE